MKPAMMLGNDPVVVRNCAKKKKAAWQLANSSLTYVSKACPTYPQKMEKMQMYFHDFMIDRFKYILYLCMYTVPLYI
jgi:hypothetical protein